MLLNFLNFNVNINLINERKVTPMDRVETTANRIKEALTLRKKKQIDLVKETGIDKGSISYYCSGKYEPKQDAIYKLAKALSVSEMWLWGYDCSRERPVEQKESDELTDLIDKLQEDSDLRGKVLKLSKGELHVESSDKILQYYNKLNDLGKKEATKRVEELTYIPLYSNSEQNNMLNAAHSLDNATDEEKANDENIMNDENF